MERRLSSQQTYNLVRRHASSATMLRRPVEFPTEAQLEATGWISLRRPRTDVLTAELDEDSFFLAFDEWGSFIEHSLGQYAKAHTDIVASVYTRKGPSGNHSRGEGHSERGFHSACFIGVVGRDSTPILDTIALALTNQVGVPKEVVEACLKDETKSGRSAAETHPNTSDLRPIRPGTLRTASAGHRKGRTSGLPKWTGPRLTLKSRCSAPRQSGRVVGRAGGRHRETATHPRRSAPL